MGNTIRVHILGAAETVTGSKYLIETSRAKVLLDCGIFQGRKELRLRNWQPLPFEARELDAIVLTHAHNDHTGYLPCVTNQGFSGPIYCTPATAQLTNLILLDSAHLQEEEARFANKHHSSKHKPARPLYTTEDAKQALSLLHPVPRENITEVAPGVKIGFRCAGHILGATSIFVEAEGKRIVFSGDIGRYDVPLLPDPQPQALGELLFCESTYGDRLHEPESVEERLAKLIKTVVERKGPLIIPAFAVGRTQTLLYYISKLEREGKIPVLPVYVDSPMAIDVTKIYKNFRNDFDEESQAIAKGGASPLYTEQTIFTQTSDQSKKLNDVRGPRIIISASGMVNGGRILHHMSHWLPDENATVLFVGYQAEDTRGRIILSGAPTVKIFGNDTPIRAHVEEVSGLSAHGDKNELLRWLRSCSGHPSLVRIIHGEAEAARSFADTVEKELGWKAQAGKQEELVEI